MGVWSGPRAVWPKRFAYIHPRTADATAPSGRHTLRRLRFAAAVRIRLSAPPFREDAHRHANNVRGAIRFCAVMPRASVRLWVTLNSCTARSFDRTCRAIGEVSVQPIVSTADGGI